MLRSLSALALACAAVLPIAAPAQTSSLPVLTPTQTLTPTDQETYPTPGSYPYDLLFGASLALDENTILASMVRYNNQTGRIAVFTKGADGQWARTGSIDPTPPIEFDFFGGMSKLDHDYLMATADTGTFLFHKEHGAWTQTDKLSGVLAWNGPGQTIDPPWAFIVGDVYRIDAHGKLQKTGQTLSNGEDSFGSVDAAEGDTLAIADTSYNTDVGTVYVYAHRQGQWVEKQQLVPSDGAIEDSFGIGIEISGDLMAITSSGKNLRYENPDCPGTYYTGGAVYIFKRVQGTWTQQQEINADCVFFDGEVSLSQDWLAINGGMDNIVYHRSQEKGPDMFVPFGHTGPDIFGVTMKLHGHIMVVGTGAQEEFPPGAVYVYDLRDKSK